MDAGLNPLLAYAAGALTILSPCVLPLVPIVLGSAAQRHRLGPLALALGLVWSPCVGPTLGAATVLAAQGHDLGQVAWVMVAFGAGIGSVLMIIAFATRSFLARWRGRLMQAGHGGKRLLGALIAVVGLLILTGADRSVEAAVLAATPDWLTDFTTSI